MAKLDDEKINAAFAPHLGPNEALHRWAFGVRQPTMWLIVPLTALAIVPGLIAASMLTKKYLVGLTDRRLIVLQVKDYNNSGVKEVTEYRLDDLRDMEVKTSTGMLFTHIKIIDRAKPFVAKFHRAFSKNNRPHAMAIAQAIDPLTEGA
jgi:hypothetical protein